MLKIGEFSVLSGMSIPMLRHYDNLDLLKPDSINNETNYRYYSEDKLIVARKIVVLKSLGYSLLEIKRIVEDKDIDFSNILHDMLQKKKEEIKEIEFQIDNLNEAYENIIANDYSLFDFTIKEISAKKMVSCRDTIHEYIDEGILWNRLNTYINDNNIKRALPNYNIAITHSFDINNKNFDIEVACEVIDNGNKLIVTREKELIASMLFKGNYNKLGSLYKIIFDLIKKRGYKVIGRTYLLYLFGPSNSENTSSYITELCVPIKK